MLIVTNLCIVQKNDLIYFKSMQTSNLLQVLTHNIEVIHHREHINGHGDLRLNDDSKLKSRPSN